MKALIISIFLLLSWLSTTGFSQWSPTITGGQSITSISAVNNDVVWAVSSDNKVFRTDNGGSTWSSSTFASAPITVFGIDLSNALVVTNDFGTSQSKVWRTSGGGGNWSQVFSQMNGYIEAIHIFPNGTGIMVGDAIGGRWSIWKTTDNGFTWDSSGMYLAGTGFILPNCLYASGGNYAFGTNTGIYASTNSGSSWTFSPTSGISAIWITGSSGLAGGSSAGYKTTNGGILWSSSTLPAGGTVQGITGYGNTFYMTLAGTSIYKTTDAGSNWTPDFTSPDLKLATALSRNGNRAWVGGATGIIWRTTTLASITLQTNEIPGEYSLEQNYPNPFNPTTNLKFKIKSENIVKLSVFDAAGKEVAVLVNGKLNAGEYEYTLDGSKLSSGVYFYTLQTEGFVETKKMMLVK
ncbi:MAG: T9SS type A sorting domain-containing protein [Ignavibacteriae bacterium]|nr:T9SS type A sorting domain-containing protein [Ignavibacteriota bacterium]MCB9243626.1 T9SS type A sorting domain-containing protein [Ignavibacteriales bacterium]